MNLLHFRDGCKGSGWQRTDSGMGFLSPLFSHGQCNNEATFFFVSSLRRSTTSPEVYT